VQPHAEGDGGGQRGEARHPPSVRQGERHLRLGARLGAGETSRADPRAESHTAGGGVVRRFLLHHGQRRVARGEGRDAARPRFAPHAAEARGARRPAARRRRREGRRHRPGHAAAYRRLVRRRGVQRAHGRPHRAVWVRGALNPHFPNSSSMLYAFTLPSAYPMYNNTCGNRFSLTSLSVEIAVIAFGALPTGRTSTIFTSFSSFSFVVFHAEMTYSWACEVPTSQYCLPFCI